MNQPRFRSYNFLGLPPQFAEFERSQFVILPVPYEQTTTYQGGTKNAPQAIIAASQQVETFDEELKLEACEVGICTLEEMEVTSAGPEKMLDRIARTSGELLERGKKLMMLGGEHTISIGAVRAFQKRHPNLSVLQMDAHADLRESYQENRFSHACVMRRIGELSHFVGLGIRNLSAEEHEFLGQSRADVFLAHQLRRDDRWKEKVLNTLGPDVYLTLDLDFFDPSIMPAVGTPEPGGFGWDETSDFLRALIEEKNVVGFDVVELCPIPGFVAPDFLAARLIYKIITYMVHKERGK